MNTFKFNSDLIKENPQYILALAYIEAMAVSMHYASTISQLTGKPENEIEKELNIFRHQIREDIKGSLEGKTFYSMPPQNP